MKIQAEAEGAHAHLKLGLDFTLLFYKFGLVIFNEGPIILDQSRILELAGQTCK